MASPRRRPFEEDEEEEEWPRLKLDSEAEGVGRPSPFEGSWLLKLLVSGEGRPETGEKDEREEVDDEEEEVGEAKER